MSALAFLHSQTTPIIHNEVTIQNVFLNLVGELQDLKLIDFGCARLLNQPPAKPNLEELNPFYLAPERFSGVCSVQTDLYSVGVMMYQLLYGVLPWFIDVSRKRGQEAIDAILAKRDEELELTKEDKYELDDQLLKFLSQQSKDKPVSTETKKKGEGFAAVAGMEELKQQMREEVIEPLHNPEEYHRYGVTIPNGMLLYGPPGCGKTFFAKHFAEEVGFNFLCITPAALKSRFVNATQENNWFLIARMAMCTKCQGVP